MKHKNAVVALLAVALVLIVTGCTLRVESRPEYSQKPATVQPTQVPEPTVTVEATIPGLTPSQDAAIRKAELYLSMAGFSQGGLQQQLEFEKFSKEDAAFAVANVKTDWNENAFRKGELYLDTMGLSRAGLIQQLKFEKFTDEQATYAADKLGL